MMAVLDTVGLQHLLRRPKKNRNGEGRVAQLLSRRTALDPILKDKRLRLALDSANGLLSEWQRTCGREAVHVVVTTWGDWGAIAYIKDPPKLGQSTARTLRQLEFLDPVDKLVIRLALALTPKFIVTEDSDFWDPTDKESKGNQNAPVAVYCREAHGIRMWLLGDFLRHVGCAEEKRKSRVRPSPSRRRRSDL